MYHHDDDDEYYDPRPWIQIQMEELNGRDGHRARCAWAAGGDCTCGVAPPDDALDPTYLYGTDRPDVEASADPSAPDWKSFAASQAALTNPDDDVPF